MQGLQGAVDGDRRPYCLILDEVDGALNTGDGKSGIAALVRMASGAAGNGGLRVVVGTHACCTSIPAGDADAPVSKSRRKRPPAVLRRPVICVCNDVYAPALRPLRDVAQELRLRRVLPERLVRRLRAVCTQEQVDTDRQVCACVLDILWILWILLDIVHRAHAVLGIC